MNPEISYNMFEVMEEGGRGEGGGGGGGGGSEEEVEQYHQGRL